MKIPREAIFVFFKEKQESRDQFAQTPKSLLIKLEELYGKFDFDPCPVNPTFDGLTVEWGQNNYVNPPFKKMKPWLKKATEEWKKGKQVIFLMPIRIHTKYFIETVYPLLKSGDVTMHVLEGGVTFENYKSRAPFGMMYLHFKSSSTSSTQE
jgi:hypothetical protein